MTPVQPEELSALIDQELDARRAEEVRNQISADPVLRAQFETLRHLDARWQSAARTAAFIPIIRSPDTRWITWGRGLGLALLLVGLRIATKVIDTQLIAFAIHGVALVAVLAVFAWMAREDEKDLPDSVSPFPG